MTKTQVAAKASKADQNGFICYQYMRGYTVETDTDTVEYRFLQVNTYENCRFDALVGTHIKHMQS